MPAVGVLAPAGAEPFPHPPVDNVWTTVWIPGKTRGAKGPMAKTHIFCATKTHNNFNMLKKTP